MSVYSLSITESVFLERLANFLLQSQLLTEKCVIAFCAEDRAAILFWKAASWFFRKEHLALYLSQSVFVALSTEQKLKGRTNTKIQSKQKTVPSECASKT